jgi:hypothetical protein
MQEIILKTDTFVFSYRVAGILIRDDNNIAAKTG